MKIARIGITKASGSWKIAESSWCMHYTATVTWINFKFWIAHRFRSLLKKSYYVRLKNFINVVMELKLLIINAFFLLLTIRKLSNIMQKDCESHTKSSSILSLANKVHLETALTLRKHKTQSWSRNIVIFKSSSKLMR